MQHVNTVDRIDRALAEALAEALADALAEAPANALVNPLANTFINPRAPAQWIVIIVRTTIDRGIA